MVESLTRHGRVLLVYVVVGVAMYWAALGAFFVSDDFEFLTIVVSAKSWLVIFEPLVGRYVRPFVVLMYYACYTLFGLAPWAYHVATLLPHLAAAFLVYAVGLRLFGGPGRSAPRPAEPDPRFLAFLGGLFFLVFSGHSEAVAWPAGIADPIVAVFLLLSFLLYLRAMEPAASSWLVFLSYLAMLGAALTKEIWVTYPGILLAHAALLGRREPQAVRRAAILVLATAATVVAYLVMRQTVFGSVTGGYSGLGTSFGTSSWLTEVHAFVLRCFVPAGVWAVRLWQRLDLFVWPAVAILMFWRVRGRDVRVVVFTAAAMLLALLPVLPLTISVATTESERFIYVATVFSCLLVVASASAILRNRVAVAAACGTLMAWHGVVLVQNTHRWRDAGVMARGIIDSFADGVRRYDSGNRQPIFLLNLPDNLHGAYVYRRGFYPAIQLFAPDVAASTGRAFGIATNSFTRLRDTTTATRTGSNGFTLDVTPGRLIQPAIPPSSWYSIVSQTPASYEARFSEAVTSAVVFHTTAGRVEYVGTTTSRGLPFGALDIPADEAVCTAAEIRFSGWALDDQLVARVSVDVAGDDATARPLGDAAFATGSRPDVAAMYGWLPNSRRAEWNYLLPCATVAAAPGGALRVRVTAIDGDGQRTDLGSRLVKAGR